MIKLTDQKSDYVLYNLAFPLWFIVWIPGWWWLVLIPINFLIDYTVHGLSIRKIELAEKSEIKRKSIFRVCLCGFLSDFIGALFLFGIYMIVTFFGEIFIDLGNRDFGLALCRWAGNSMSSCWNNVPAFVLTVVSVAVSALCIFIFNKQLFINKFGLSEYHAEYIAVRLAVYTAPYLFLIPLIF